MHSIIHCKKCAICESYWANAWENFYQKILCRHRNKIKITQHFDTNSFNKNLIAFEADWLPI